MAYLVAKKSHDPRSKIGAIITSDDNMIFSIGYNGLPRGISVSEEILKSSTKYNVMCHAEENAILNATRSGVNLTGAKIYVNLTPCNNCARMIIQSGIREVVVHKKGQELYEQTSSRPEHFWEDSFKWTKSMFSEAGIKMRFVNVEINLINGYFNGKKIPLRS